MITSGCKSLLKICFENSKHSLIRFVAYNNLHNINDMKQDTLSSRLLGALDKKRGGDKFLRSHCAGIDYTVTIDCFMVHRIVRLNLNWTEDYSSIVTVYKSKVKISNDV